jgi:hypothetical protein
MESAQTVNNPEQKLPTINKLNIRALIRSSYNQSESNAVVLFLNLYDAVSVECLGRSPNCSFARIS